ncbi:MAG: glycosyltransferase family A protein [Thermodesulfobacteriota bacterium]
MNDGSEMPLEKIIALFEDNSDVILYTQTNSGHGTARKYGAKIAKGDFLALTDDDCQPERNWLMEWVMGGGARSHYNLDALEEAMALVKVV